MKSLNGPNMQVDDENDRISYIHLCHSCFHLSESTEEVEYCLKCGKQLSLKREAEAEDLQAIPEEHWDDEEGLAKKLPRQVLEAEGTIRYYDEEDLEDMEDLEEGFPETMDDLVVNGLTVIW